MSDACGTPATVGRVVQVGVDLATHGLSHLASLHARRQAAGAPLALPEGAGAVPVATCHRLELYLHDVTDAQAIEIFERWVGSAAGHAAPTVRRGDEVATHLFRVSAGLESAVLGEDQILAQLRAAYRSANGDGLASGPLHRLFHVAFRVGRQVRSDTSLSGGVRSLAGAAVTVVHRRVGGLRGRSALVLGAGEMARLAARALADREVGRLIIANRTPERAAALAATVGAECTPWEWRAAVLPLADVVVCATSATRVLEPAALSAAAERRTAPLVIADLGVPPNVESSPIAGVETFDVAAFAALLGQDAVRRRDAIGAAEAIIAQAVPDWLSRPPAADACGARCGASGPSRRRAG